MKLTNKIKEVFVNDGYGGIARLELDWEQDAVFQYGDLNDAYETIDDHFAYSNDDWYSSLEDCVKENNPYTELG